MHPWKAASAHARYAWYITRHKWFVLVAGRRTGAPLWRLVVHDFSKLSRAEWGPYVHNFYGWTNGHRSDEVKEAFDRAWLHHQRVNEHHWQAAVLIEDSGAVKALPMKEPLVREMVADWMGAGRTITGRWEVSKWYWGEAVGQGSRDRMILHPETRLLVERLVQEVS